MAPCGWEVVSCGGCGTCWDKHSPAVRERAQAIAAMIMWAATGRRYGPCPVTVQPAGQCSPPPLYQTYGLGPGGYAITSPVIDGGVWYNRPSGSGCCSSGCEVELEGPVTKSQITSVTLAGQTLDPSAYAVFDSRSLVRIDGGCWPCCVNYGAQTPAAFTVTYLVGRPIPPAVQAAFERLACDVAKSCAGGDCALPSRITRLSRQGVDLEVEQVPVDETGNVLTGIKEVDDVIRAVNPHRLTAAPMVMSLDVPVPRRLT